MLSWLAWFDSAFNYSREREGMISLNQWKSCSASLLRFHKFSHVHSSLSLQPWGLATWLEIKHIWFSGVWFVGPVPKFHPISALVRKLYSPAYRVQEIIKMKIPWWHLVTFLSNGSFKKSTIIWGYLLYSPVRQVTLWRSNSTEIIAMIFMAEWKLELTYPTSTPWPLKQSSSSDGWGHSGGS